MGLIIRNQGVVFWPDGPTGRPNTSSGVPPPGTPLAVPPSVTPSNRIKVFRP
jgi:hypothetical protein